MKCENCGSQQTVQAFSLTIANIGGLIELMLCWACRAQFRVAIEHETRVAA